MKYQDFGEEEFKFENQKILFESFKKSLVLNVIFSKSMLVLIKIGVCKIEAWTFVLIYIQDVLGKVITIKVN